MTTNTSKAIIAYQGHQGAYSHLSCQRVFPNFEAHACMTFSAAMAMVECGDAHIAMIPVENSTAGRVEEIYRQLPHTSLYVVGEHYEPVNHCLMGTPDSSLEQIKSVGSHPQALAQCDKHLNSLNIRPLATLDTAGAALEVSQKGDPSHGAIASSLAAKLYELKILQENFQDVQGNTTRFLILSREHQIPTAVAGQKFITSFLFTVRNLPSALYKAMGGFATNNLNLIKLESYTPDGRMVATQFHVDVEAHPNDANMILAMDELAYFAKDIRMLGTYAASDYRYAEV
ncbi:MAG TPA: prephenate dehydratase [Oceanospirillaceae bacterium]|nr:prephenate dehydratase [Oceanospirillaceae bacterium]